MKHEPLTPGARRTVQVAVDEGLLAEAEMLGIDPGALADRALAVEVKRTRDRRWKEENREWIDAHRRWVESNELSLERYRLF